MSDFLVYLFWPNPGNATYGSPKAIALTVLCFLLIALSFAVKNWRKKQGSITKKLSRSWSSAFMWFGLTGLFLVVCRAEGISYVSMRVWWGVWLLIFAIYGFVQFKMFRSRHYEVLPQEKQQEDPRQKYLPKKKK